MTTQGERPFEDDLYDRFPPGQQFEYGPAQGYNRYLHVNDASLFRPELLDERDPQFNPVLAAFVNAPFSVNFAVFKSSTRESEWALHKPHRTMAGTVPGIEGRVEGFPEDRAKQLVGTFIINHQHTMARLKQYSLTIEDKKQAGQMIYKQEDDGQENPDFGPIESS